MMGIKTSNENQERALSDLASQFPLAAGIFQYGLNIYARYVRGLLDILGHVLERLRCKSREWRKGIVWGKKFSGDFVVNAREMRYRYVSPLRGTGSII